MEFYPGFAWAVPRAFGAAVSACRFELGDVLYDDESAYGPKPENRHHIQLFEPARSTRSLASESEGQRFFVNWDAPIRYEWKDYGSDATRMRTSTQGRLFSCLWRGDPDVLDEERAPAPEPPLLLRELSGRVEKAVPALRKSLRIGARSKETHLFAFATDGASDASRSKAAAVLSLLEARYSCRFRDLAPAKAGIDDGPRFHPALAVRGIAIKAASAEEVQETLKGLLYRGSAATKGADEGMEDSEDSDSTADAEKASPDRFKVARHGVFVALD
jgi:hypothetical protein